MRLNASASLSPSEETGAGSAFSVPLGLPFFDGRPELF